jgi:hypothetical protein
VAVVGDASKHESLIELVDERAVSASEETMWSAAMTARAA